jgi:hypothetical protein
MAKFPSPAEAEKFAFCQCRHLIPQSGHRNIENLWTEIRKSARRLYKSGFTTTAWRRHRPFRQTASVADQCVTA